MQQNFKRSLRKIIIKGEDIMENLRNYMERTFFEEMRPSNFFDESGKELALGWEDYNEYEVVEVRNIDDSSVTEKNITVKHK